MNNENTIIMLTDCMLDIIAETYRDSLPVRPYWEFIFTEP